MAPVGERDAEVGRRLDRLAEHRQARVVEKTRERETVAGVLGGIGGVHFLRGAFDAALDHYRRSLAVREELGDARACALTLAQIGLVLAAQEKPDESRATYEKSLERAQASGGGEAVAIALALLASADAALGKPDSALELAGKAATRGAGAGSLDVVARAKLVAGDAHRLRGEPDRAEVAVREAIVAVERLKAAGTRADERFFNDTIAPYLSMVNLLVEQKRTDDAFAMLERARQVRMQSLLEDASSPRASRPRSRRRSAACASASSRCGRRSGRRTTGRTRTRCASRARRGPGRGRRSTAGVRDAALWVAPRPEGPARAG